MSKKQHTWTYAGHTEMHLHISANMEAGPQNATHVSLTGR